MSSVSLGYGDIVPITYAEKILTCFLALYVASLLCYAPCEIGIIYSRFNIKSEKEIKQLEKLKYFLKKRGISSGMMLKVRKYVQY